MHLTVDREKREHPRQVLPKIKSGLNLHKINIKTEQLHLQMVQQIRDFKKM